MTDMREPGNGSTVKSVLLYDKPEVDIYTQNKKWINFVQEKLEGKPQEGRHIARIHTEAATAIRASMIRKGTTFLAKKNDEYFCARVENTDGGTITATRFQHDGNHVEIVLDYSDIVVDVDEGLKVIDSEFLLMSAEDQDKFYSCLEFGEAAKLNLAQANFAAVKEHTYVELILEEDPKWVAVARIERNFRGLLLLEFNGFNRWVHMYSPLLHEIGWVGTQATWEYATEYDHAVKYVNGCQDITDLTSIPKFLCRDNVLFKHRLEPMDVFVFLDDDGRTFHYAHVDTESPSNSRFFFWAKCGDRTIRNKNNVYASNLHVYDPRIFSVRMARNMGVNIRLPSEIEPVDYDTDLEKYIEEYCTKKGKPEARLLGDNIGAQYEYKYFRQKLLDEATRNEIDERMTSLKYLEILRPTPGGGFQLTAAEVTKHTEFIIRMRVNGESQPVYAHLNDPKLFHFGACMDMGLAINFQLNELGAPLNSRSDRLNIKMNGNAET